MTTISVLYLKDRLNVHDDRFTAALRDRGHEVVRATEASDGSWLLEDGRTLGLDALLALDPSVVQVGPLTLAGSLEPALGRVPVVVTCWGSDAFLPLAEPARRVVAAAAAVLADCHGLDPELLASGARSDRLVHFPWGIDLGVHHPPADEPAPPAVRRLVATRTLDPFYRHDDLLHALARAQDAGPVRLDLFGSGPAEPELRSLVVELGLSSLVAFHHPVSERELAAELRRSTAWVNAAPSDGICISLLQALANGAGIVTTDVPCAREAAGPGSATFVPSGDLAALAAAFATARRPDARERAVNAAWLASYADWSGNAERYVDALVEAAS